MNYPLTLEQDTNPVIEPEHMEKGQWYKCLQAANGGVFTKDSFYLCVEYTGTNNKKFLVDNFGELVGIRNLVSQFRLHTGDVKVTTT